MYKDAVIHELKNTLEQWTKLLEMSQAPETANRVSKEQLDTLRLKINGLMSQLNQEAA